MKIRLILFAVLSLHFGFLFSQKAHQIDSLNHKFLQAANDSQRVDLSVELGRSFIRINLDSAIYFFERGMEYSRKIKSKKMESDGCFWIGKAYSMYNDYPQAFKYWQKAIDILGNAHNSTLGFYMNHLGMIHHQLKNNKEALNYYKKSLEVRDYSKTQSVSFCMTNLGNLYEETGLPDSALNYYNMAIKNWKELLIRYTKSKEKVEIVRVKRGTSYTLQCMGTALMNKKEYKKAREIFEQSLKFAKDAPAADMELTVYNKLADYYIVSGDFNEAIHQASLAYSLKEKVKDTESEIEIYNLFSKAYEGLNNFQKALEYHKLFKQLNDSIFNTEKNKKLSELEVRYQTQKKEQQLKVKNLQLEQAKVQRFAMIGGLLLLLLIISIVYVSYRNKKKANILLFQQKTEISEKNEELYQQKEEITAILEELTKLNHELEKLSIVASKTDNGVAIMDGEGNLEWINPGFEKLIGYNLQELTEMNRGNIRHISGNPDFEKILNSCLNEWKTIIYENSMKTRSGSELWTQTTLTPIHDPKGNHTKLIIVDSDITNLKKAENEIKQKNEEIESARRELERKNTLIVDSIKYAKLIQDAILPASVMLKNAFEKIFIIYIPRDIVSGDFYWMHNMNGNTLFALADCTGHGVHGAFLSMIGNTLLNEIVKEKKITSPATILEKLNEGINYLMQQSGNSHDAGMDITVINVSENKKKVTIASAAQDLFIVEKGMVKRIEGSINSIGDSLSNSNKDSFVNTELNISENFSLYLMSDGFTDQFGEKNPEKFSSQRMIALLESVAELTVEKQEENILRAFYEWKEQSRQIDDVTVVGILF